MEQSRKDTGAAHNVLYEVEQLPVFQNRMYATREAAIDCPKGDMRLVEDQATGLVYNSLFEPDLLLYDEHYQNEQAVSAAFREHLDRVLEIIAALIGRNSIVEVGCGKGYFLEMLLADGFDARGCDPTYEGDNPRVIKENFSPALGIQADGLVLRHVLEHIQNPVEFLIALKEANGGSGKIYIEVPCFDWICEQRAWFDIFYEHVNYFRLADFHRMFGVVHASGRLFGDQYLYVVADLSSIRTPERDSQFPARLPEDFASGLTDNYGVDEGEEVIVWGGASKGVIFALLKQRAGFDIRTVIDINPAKHDKYLAASGLQVQTPQKALINLAADSKILVMNSNYLDEIRSMTAGKFECLSIDVETPHS